MLQQVAVTGMGIISSIGKSVIEFADSLQTGRCGIGLIRSETEPPISVKIGAEIKEFTFESALNNFSLFPTDSIQKAKQCARRSPYAIQILLITALEAWRQAQLYESPITSNRIGLIIAGNNLSQNYQYSLYETFQKNPEYLTPKYPLHFMDTDHVGTLSEVFSINGEGFTIGGASASGNIAIIKGYQLIRSGLADACIVGGALADLSPMDLQGFYNIGAMGGERFYSNPKQACRPFDKDHEGFIYGQASGCLILESMTSAQKRGIPVLAEILGGAIVLDGNRLSNPNEEGETNAMRSALNVAQINEDSVDYLNSHGTSSPLGDETEIKAIKKVFKNNVSNIWINATKGLTGHCLYSAGIIECIATIIQMQKRFVHPNINLINPIDDECRFSMQESIHTPINIAMSNAFGFGGINTSLIIKGD